MRSASDRSRHGGRLVGFGVVGILVVIVGLGSFQISDLKFQIPDAVGESPKKIVVGSKDFTESVILGRDPRPNA